MTSEMPPKKLNMGSKLVRVMFRPQVATGGLGC